ncbi:MAG: hypothetical protein K6E78_02900 [Treponema sp.]|nr:hypothetical protein [Treponema sp.]
MKQKGLFLLFLIFGFKIFAQTSFFDDYVYHMWNSFGSLTGTTATDLIQTEDGYINIGTYEGLVRFDGVAFTTLKKSKDNDWKFASCRCVLEDSRGNLWIGSNDEGLQKISREGNKCYTMQSGLPNNSVRTLVEDKKGNIWVGTATGVVYITPKGYIITPQFEAGTVSKGVIATHLYCDTAGRIWLVTANEKGLFLFSDGIFRTRPELDVFGNYLVSSIFQDLQGNFWISMGDQGIIRLFPGKIEKVKTGTILDNIPTICSYVSKSGTIWFGTEKGLVVYDNGQYYPYNGSSLSNANINRIICDREGNIWFATDRNGIGKMTHGKFRMNHVGYTVNSLTEDRSGKIWAGTDNGVICYENDKRVENKLTEFTKNLRVRDVQATKNGDILVSCYTKPGQIRYSKNGQIKSWSTDQGLAGNKVRCAIETDPNVLYVGTTTGLSIIHEDGSIKNIKQADGLDNEYVMTIYEDTNEIIWVGTDGYGVYLIKDEEIFAHFSSDDGLIGNVIFKITQDLDGSFWICTGSGISHLPGFDSRKGVPTVFENINSEKGIQTDSVFQVLADSTNNLWMISNHGISSTPFADMLETATGKMEAVEVKFYNRNDGLDSDGPTSTAKSIIDRFGRIWFTMVDGIAIYDPIKIFENPITPLVQIESVAVDNKVYSRMDRTITLKPGTKRVEIKFTGISFDAPERILFTHKLTNFEKDFSAPSPERTLSYTNLRPGKHTFLVNAINGDGLYSDQAEAVLFVQKPYVYQMPLFWIFIAIAIFSSITLFFYVKQQRIRLENIKLEKKVKQRTRELEAEKSKSDKLLKAILPEKIAEELKDEIKAIGYNYEEITILFSDIVEFTKISSGYKADVIVRALDDLFTRWDNRASSLGIEKIKTIGDAYMAACGCPTPNENHAELMAQFAKGMLEDLEEYNKTAEIKFQIRIGLNTGPVTAGVICRTRFIYDIWGNAVNVASRMESVATPGKIRISESLYNLLKDKNFKFSEPIECNIKGKGIMITYDLL